MRNQYRHLRIEKIIEHNERTRSFVLNGNITSNPGQFVMVWLSGIDEKPISLSSVDRITVRNVGPFTAALFEKRKGDYIDIRGPYGNGFNVTGKNTLIGGGCGIAPLMYLVEKNAASGMVLAGRTKSDLIFLDEIIERIGANNVIGVTEDGSYGIKGLATDASIPRAEHHYYMCGPEIMMKKIGEKLSNEGVDPSFIYLSMERYMKCAIKECGNCSFSGYSVCSDGPVFRYDMVKDLPHFNEKHRTRTGELRGLKE